MNTTFRTWLEAHFSEDGRTIKKGFPVKAKDALQIIDSLTNWLRDELAPGSTGILEPGDQSREGDFKLDRTSDASPSRPEDRAEREIFRLYNCEHPPLLDGSEGSAFLTKIPSFQVPLAAKRDDGRGKVDLLAMTNEGLPAVIELKALGRKSGRSAGQLLGPIVQGLAYMLTIRHYWRASSGFRKEWSNRIARCDLPVDLENRRTPIVVMADRDFWASSMTWEKCPWSNFLALSKAFEDANVPLFAARFPNAENPVLEFSRFDRLEGSDAGTCSLWP